MNIPCIICGATDKWENVDKFRTKPANMCICMGCGFITFPDTIAKTNDLKEFYRAEYREAPSAQNVFTGQRKLHYHSEFLGDLFKKWKEEKKNPVVGEIGSAFGMFLNWVRANFPKAEVYGSELTLAFRRVAHHEYKLDIPEELDFTKKYDLLASYKVAEHIPNIDKDLRKYAEALSPDGLLYVSVPTWFHTMSNFGLSGFSLDYYYHTNHINVWTQKLFETLLKKCGLEILKKDDVVYDSTYLCKRNDALMDTPPLYEDPKEILSLLEKIKKASDLNDEGKYQEALAVFPAFPQAWVHAYEMKRKEWHTKGFEVIHEEIIKKGLLANCPKASYASQFAGDLCMRYNQWPLAIQYIEKALNQKPGDPGCFIMLGHCYRNLAEASADPKEKEKHQRAAAHIMGILRSVSFQHSHEAVTWLFSDYARIPCPLEVKQ